MVVVQEKANKIWIIFQMGNIKRFIWTGKASRYKHKTQEKKILHFARAIVHMLNLLWKNTEWLEWDFIIKLYAHCG